MNDPDSEMSIPLEKVSFILPAKNEAGSVGETVKGIRGLFPKAQILVIDDGSSDSTASVARAAGADVVSHLYSRGNGAAIKTGARAARGEILVFMDADGQHQPHEAADLLRQIKAGHDMVVGARKASGQASFFRGMANGIYNRLASWMVEQPVHDLTSGFRAVRSNRFREFLYLLPNGFSYPTTSTMAFFRAGYSVAYVPIDVRQRVKGSASHIRIWKDGTRFLLIIFKIGTLFSPVKIFAPVSFMFFLAGLGNYAYTYFTAGRFTNMSVLMFSASVIIFLIGLISEQITALMYKDSEKG